MSKVRELLVSSHEYLAQFTGVDFAAMEPPQLASALDATTAFAAAYVSACVADGVECSAELVEEVERVAQAMARALGADAGTEVEA